MQIKYCSQGLVTYSVPSHLIVSAVACSPASKETILEAYRGVFSWRHRAVHVILPYVCKPSKDTYNEEILVDVLMCQFDMLICYMIMDYTAVRLVCGTGILGGG